MFILIHRYCFVEIVIISPYAAEALLVSSFGLILKKALLISSHTCIHLIYHVPVKQQFT